MAARRYTQRRATATSTTNQVTARHLASYSATAARSLLMSLNQKGVVMKRVALSIFTVLAMLLTCSFALRKSRIPASFSTPPRSASLTAGFTKLETEMMEAIKQKDMPRLEQLLAPDYVLVTSSRAGDPMDRKSWFELIALYYNVESFTIGDVVVRCLVPRGNAGEACDLAAVSLIITQKAIVGGEDRSGDGFDVDIWARHNGSWQLFSRFAGHKNK